VGKEGIVSVALRSKIEFWKKEHAEFIRGVQGLARFAFLLAVVWFLLWTAVKVYIWLNENGTLSTTRPAVITASSDWLDGETKTCDAANVLDQSGIPYVWCGEGPRHQIKVAFYGPFAGTRLWNCTRGNDNSFSCRAVIH
jgi:hypothetical protein